MIAPPDLQFDPIGHIYQYRGRRVPSVTQVLKDMGLVDYSKIPQDVLQLACARGTAVHIATQLWDENDLEESSIADELRPYLTAWMRFRNETGFLCELNEARGYDPSLVVAGTLDRSGLLCKSAVILDIKTGILLPGHALQLTAYAQFFAAPRKYRRYVVQLKDDATYKLTEFPIETYARDLMTWQAAASLWHWRSNRQLIRARESEEYAYV